MAKINNQQKTAREGEKGIHGLGKTLVTVTELS